MIYATTELAIRKLLDDNPDQILKAGVDGNGKYVLLMTNKLQCQYHRLMKNMKEVEDLTAIDYKRSAATKPISAPAPKASSV